MPRDIVSSLDRLRLVVSHSLQGIDEVNKLETPIDIFVKTANPVHYITMLYLRRTIKSRQKYAQVVRIDLPMGIPINHSEDRQNGVVKLADKLLLEQLNSL